MVTLLINGKSYRVDAPAETPLLWIIRERLRLTGTKYGCGIDQCGSCTVHFDGTSVRACSVSVTDAVRSLSIATSFFAATGARVRHLPFLAERVRTALQGKP